MRRILLALLSLAALAAPALAGPETLTVQAGKTSRELILYAPSSSRGPVPVVMVFHGGGGGADWMTGKSRGLTRTLTEAGYAVAFMNGSSRRDSEKLRTWNAVHCCAYAAKANINEAAYADAAVEALDQRLGIDRTRIFLMGHSNGAMLSYRLASAMKTAPRAIAPVSGAIFADQPDVPDRTSIFMYHAVDDEVLSYDGHPDDKAERWRTAPHLGFTKAEAKLAELKACGPAAPASAPAGLTATTRSCAGGSVLLATSAETGGHEWPARPKADYRIEQALLAFFDSQR
ncbi:alpha/beta hydrolase family esterase [Hyphomonas sp.]|uniref:alpha/beta hydrolase family esterase n=1 Tax=Hyphomonas sp. TaxID=87 RepID=UPI00391D946E